MKSEELYELAKLHLDSLYAKTKEAETLVKQDERVMGDMEDRFHEMAEQLEEQTKTILRMEDEIRSLKAEIGRYITELVRQGNKLNEMKGEQSVRNG